MAVEGSVAAQVIGENIAILELQQECEILDAGGPVYRPDPEWSYTDSLGRVHKWDGDELPTLKQVEVEMPEHCCECGHPTGESEWVKRWIVEETEEIVEPDYTVTYEENKVKGMEWCDLIALATVKDSWQPGEERKYIDFPWHGHIIRVHHVICTATETDIVNDKVQMHLKGGRLEVR